MAPQTNNAAEKRKPQDFDIGAINPQADREYDASKSLSPEKQAGETIDLGAARQRREAAQQQAHAEVTSVQQHAKQVAKEGATPNQARALDDTAKAALAAERKLLQQLDAAERNLAKAKKELESRKKHLFTMFSGSEAEIHKAMAQIEFDEAKAELDRLQEQFNAAPEGQAKKTRDSRVKASEAQAAMEKKSRGLFGLYKKEGGWEVEVARQEAEVAASEYEKARAELIADDIEAALSEKIAQMDARAEALQDTKSRLLQSLNETVVGPFTRKGVVRSALLVGGVAAGIGGAGAAAFGALAARRLLSGAVVGAAGYSGAAAWEARSIQSEIKKGGGQHSENTSLLGWAQEKLRTITPADMRAFSDAQLEEYVAKAAELAAIRGVRPSLDPLVMALHQETGRRIKEKITTENRDNAATALEQYMQQSDARLSQAIETVAKGELKRKLLATSAGAFIASGAMGVLVRAVYEAVVPIADAAELTDEQKEELLQKNKETLAESETSYGYIDPKAVTVLTQQGWEFEQNGDMRNVATGEKIHIKRNNVIVITYDKGIFYASTVNQQSGLNPLSKGSDFVKVMQEVAADKDNGVRVIGVSEHASSDASSVALEQAAKEDVLSKEELQQIERYTQMNMEAVQKLPLIFSITQEAAKDLAQSGRVLTEQGIVTVATGAVEPYPHAEPMNIALRAGQVVFEPAEQPSLLKATRPVVEPAAPAAAQTAPVEPTPQTAPAQQIVATPQAQPAPEQKITETKDTPQKEVDPTQSVAAEMTQQQVVTTEDVVDTTVEQKTSRFAVSAARQVAAQEAAEGKRLPESVTRWTEDVEAAAKKYDVPAPLILAIINAESSGNPNAAGIGDDGKVHGRGLAQFIQSTGKQYGLRTEKERHDPQKSIEACAHYLSDLLKKYNGRIDYAVAEYNLGGAAVNQAKDWVKNEEYVKKVLTYYYSAGGEHLSESASGGRSVYRGGVSNEPKQYFTSDTQAAYTPIAQPSAVEAEAAPLIPDYAQMNWKQQLEVAFHPQSSEAQRIAAFRAYVQKEGNTIRFDQETGTLLKPNNPAPASEIRIYAYPNRLEFQLNGKDVTLAQLPTLQLPPAEEAVKKTAAAAAEAAPVEETTTTPSPDTQPVETEKKSNGNFTVEEKKFIEQTIVGVMKENASLDDDIEPEWGTDYGRFVDDVQKAVDDILDEAREILAEANQTSNSNTEQRLRDQYTELMKDAKRLLFAAQDGPERISDADRAVLRRYGVVLPDESTGSQIASAQVRAIEEKQEIRSQKVARAIDRIFDPIRNADDVFIGALGNEDHINGAKQAMANIYWDRADEMKQLYDQTGDERHHTKAMLLEAKAKNLEQGIQSAITEQEKKIDEKIDEKSFRELRNGELLFLQTMEEVEKLSEDEKKDAIEYLYSDNYKRYIDQHVMLRRMGPQTEFTWNNTNDNQITPTERLIANAEMEAYRVASAANRLVDIENQLETATTEGLSDAAVKQLEKEKAAVEFYIQNRIQWIDKRYGSGIFEDSTHSGDLSRAQKIGRSMFSFGPGTAEENDRYSFDNQNLVDDLMKHWRLRDRSDLEDRPTNP